MIKQLTYWKFSLFVAFIWALHFCIRHPKQASEGIYVFATVFIGWPVLIVLVSIKLLAKKIHQDLKHKFEDDNASLIHKNFTSED